ncbi:MAG: peptide chain release factor 2 [bacterium]|nr:peptide chain release factor 2 [bacterium]
MLELITDLEEQLSLFNQRVTNLRGYLEIDAKIKLIEDLEKKTLDPDFWKSSEKAKAILQELNQQKKWVNDYNKLTAHLSDLQTLFDLAKEEEDVQSFQEIRLEIPTLIQQAEELELRKMLGGPDDRKNAIMTIKPGAGGTESQDWAEMLLRMYLRWLEKKGFKTEIIDYQPGEQAGIKEAAIEIVGDYAYGYCKAEIGVHRLVRISPFDANARRHTSFAAVSVIPEVEESSEIRINPNELKIDVFRASGAGGQHVNRTESAVRITHIPTGIVVTCQAERSQIKNRATAMKYLLAKLAAKQREEEEKKNAEFEAQKSDIAWGNQIRSYVFTPYTMVKDLRTGVETSNVQAVMDGDLDQFVTAFLLGKKRVKGQKDEDDE